MEGVLYSLDPAAIPTGLCLYVLIRWESIRSTPAVIINRVCLIHYESGTRQVTCGRTQICAEFTSECKTDGHNAGQILAAGDGRRQQSDSLEGNMGYPVQFPT